MNKNCPYCNALFSLDGISCDYSFPKFQKAILYLNSDKSRLTKNMGILSHYCPECSKPIMWLYEFEVEIDEPNKIGEVVPKKYDLLYPKYSLRKLNDSIPEIYAKEFTEAYLVNEFSPKASAALSRRCLQLFIHTEKQIKKKNLEEEIKELIALNILPKYLSDDLDEIRVIGNFAAHPKKNENTGEIIEVEPGESEWLLKILEELLIFNFVRVKESEDRRKEFQEKYGKK